MSCTIECPVTYTEERYHSDPYPWLAPDDPRRFQTDNQILYEQIDLSERHQKKGQIDEVGTQIQRCI